MPNARGNFTCDNTLSPASTSTRAQQQTFSCFCSGLLSSIYCDFLGPGRAGTTRFVVSADHNSGTATVSSTPLCCSCVVPIVWGDACSLQSVCPRLEQRLTSS